MRKIAAAVAALKGCATVLLLVGQPLRAAAQTPQQPPPVQFETRADLILIDASVVDGSGTPVSGLTADDLILTIDGKPRAITSLQFVASTPPKEAAPPPKAAHYSTNEGASDGRRVVIAVDENSIPPGGARAVLFSTDRFLAGLAPADRVALIRLPTFEGSVDFTTDRARVAEAAKKVVGKAVRVGTGRVSVAESVAFDRRESFEWERALSRICANLTGIELEVCRNEAEAEAAEKINTYQRRTRETLTGIAQLLANLRQIPGPKTMLLLSQGLLGYDYTIDIARLADAAASARVSLYAMHIDMPAFDVADAMPSATRSEDERLLSEDIDNLAGAARGTRFRVVGSADRVFERVARELGGYYLIGVEPTDADRDGKPHRIRVEVKRPSVTVRARAQFTIGAGTAAATAAAAPTERLLELLRAPEAEAGLPLRVAAFAAPAATADRVRIMVAADVGAASATPIPVQLGILLVDRDGKIAGNQAGTITLQPSAGDSAPRYFGSLEAPPGDYTLRLAVVDSDGRAGSVHHPLDARLEERSGVSVSDLILTTPRRGNDGLRPEVHVNLDGQALQAMIELRAAESARLDAVRVAFEISDKTDGAPLVTVPGQIRKMEGTVKPAAAILDVGVLPPGDYVARALVDVPGEKPLAITRPFQVAPRRQRAVSEPVEPARSTTSATARVPARGRARPPIPAFKKEDVLAPAVVQPFIDHVLTSYSPSPAARSALEAIKAGNVANATRGERQVGDLGLSFAQGLSMLAAGRTAEADAYFRAALRASSDFIGAAFYLGATLAAAGRDRDAIGAWETALIGEVGAAGIYPVLVDGLLRVGDGERALEVLHEADATFTDRDAFNRRLVQAYALLARYEEALPLAHDYLARHGADTDMLYLTMHVIYEAQASGATTDPGNLEKFRDYMARYTAAGGKQVLVVQGWRKALGIR